MKKERQELIQKFEEITNCDVYILFTASGGQNYSMSLDFLTLFTEAIFSRRLHRRKNAILVLETNGGDPTTVMAIVKQLRENYDKIYGYAFNRCFSAGTIGMFATDKIYMSRYALFTPVDIQCLPDTQDSYKPLVANYNAFIENSPGARDAEFAAMYHDDYLRAITVIRYEEQTVRPNFMKHCKEEYVETTWAYFNGGAGLHNTKISRKQAINELGLKVKNMPDDIEELLYNIINSYSKESNMLVNSVYQMDVKDAYFETLGLTYVHYKKYQEMWAEDQPEVKKSENTTENTKKSKQLVEDKYCVEYGWMKE